MKMKSAFLLITLVPAVLCASVGTNERMTLLVKYTMDCVKSSGVSYSALLQPSSSNDDPAYNDYLSCFADKYFSDNAIPSSNVRVVNLGQKVNLPVITSYSQKCAFQSQISAAALIQIADQNPPEDDPAYGKYLSCYLIKLGILNEDGDVADDTAKVEKWLLRGSAKTVLDSVKTNCADKEGQTAGDKALLVFNCMKKHNNSLI